MKTSSKIASACLAIISLLFSAPTMALPSDAAAVLNRCGKPLKGDEIIYEHTIAGGRRILSYERGTLNFDRVGNEGWTFTYGSHKKQDHLNAEQMDHFLPCLKDALADSASAAPIKVMTTSQRVAYDAKHMYKQLIFGSLGFLVVLGLGFLIVGRSKNEEEESF